MKSLKCNWRLLLLGVISIVVGILFCAIPTDKLLKITFYVIGALVIVNGAISLYHSIKAKNTLAIVSDIIDIAFGICLIFFHQTFMLIIIAVYLIAFPIVRIIMNPMHLVQFYRELPRFVLALVLILLTPEGVLNILFIIIGVVLIVIGIITIIGSFYTERIVK